MFPCTGIKSARYGMAHLFMDPICEGWTPAGRRTGTGKPVDAASDAGVHSFSLNVAVLRRRVRCAAEWHSELHDERLVG